MCNEKKISIEGIDTDCSACEYTATQRLKLKNMELELCDNCIKELLWLLIHDVYI